MPALCVSLAVGTYQPLDGVHILESSMRLSHLSAMRSFETDHCTKHLLRYVYFLMFHQSRYFLLDESEAQTKMMKTEFGHLHCSFCSCLGMEGVCVFNIKGTYHVVEFAMIMS